MSQGLEIGEVAKDFSLVGTDGLIYTWNSFKGYRAVVVFFTSNSCPFARGCESYLMDMAQSYRDKNVLFVAINANSEQVDPTESYEIMCERSQEQGFPWIYLRDETQRTALKFGAECTPHFFLFNRMKYLVYSGRGLDNPRNPELSRDDALKTALDELLSGTLIQTPETSPLGCSIKWNKARIEEPAEELCLSTS